MKKSKIFLTGLTLALLSSGALAGGQAQAAGTDAASKSTSSAAEEKVSKADDQANPTDDYFDVQLVLVPISGKSQPLEVGHVPAQFTNGRCPIPNKQLLEMAQQKAESLGYRKQDVDFVNSNLYMFTAPLSPSNFWQHSMPATFPLLQEKQFYFNVKIHVQGTGQTFTSKRYQLTKTAWGNIRSQDFNNHFRVSGRFLTSDDVLLVVKEVLDQNHISNYKEPTFDDVNMSPLMNGDEGSTATLNINIAGGTAQPGQVSKPSQSADSGNQGQTSQPSEPNEPSQPTNSGQTAAPTTPTNPGKSNQNDQNEQPMSGVVFLPKIPDQGNALVQLYDGQGNPSGQSLKPVTYWKVFASKIIKGQVYYRLGTDKQWIPAKLVMTTDRQPASQAKEIPMKGVLRISYRGRGKVKLTDQNGKYLPNKQSTFVANGAAFKIFARKVINGRTYYRLGTEHQWLPGQYMQKR